MDTSSKEKQFIEDKVAEYRKRDKRKSVEVFIAHAIAQAWTFGYYQRSIDGIKASMKGSK